MMDAIKLFLEYVETFFVIYLIGYSTFLFLSVTVGSSVLYRRRQQQMLHNELTHEYYVPVSIIVPAHNEEITVVDTVISLLNLKYRLYEIIVVDDGSTDDTSKVLIEHFHMQQIERPIQRKIRCQPEEYIFQTLREKVPVTLIRKKNGGKADTLNMGINVSQYPYFICMDADSMLQEDALENVVRPILEDENVVACGGLVRIANGVKLKNGRVEEYRMPKKLITCMQVLEYDRSFLASRILMDQFNGNLIISGAFGLFQKEMVIAAGGYDPSTMGEDMELVVKLHVFCRSNQIPYSIRYAPDAICWSQAPESLRDLIKQRRRWHLGLFQSMKKHHQLFLNHRYGIVSFVSYLYFLLYELFSPYIELFGILTTVLACVVNLINVPFMILFFLIYALYGAVLSLTAFLARLHTLGIRLRLSDFLKAVGLCCVEVSFLRFILAWVRMTALIGYKKKKLSWGRIQRYRLNQDRE